MIRVTASDGGGRTAVCEMKVQVQDVNDSEPQFNNLKNQIQVSTDVKQGEILYEFDVTDLGKCYPCPCPPDPCPGLDIHSVQVLQLMII